MNPDNDDDTHAAPATAPTGKPAESLNDALDDLEDMLDLHDGGDERRPTDDDDASTEDAGDDDLDVQYSIPLLNEVVTPPVLRAVPSTPSPDAPGDDQYQESVARMAERLGSEIDIIVQSAVDEAVDLLRRDIGERLREHLDITLPEVLEELIHLRQGR